MVDGPVPGLFPMRVDRTFAFAPPGICRFSSYAKGETEVPLPGAADAMLRRPDGARFGFDGSALLEIREPEWIKVHEASGGEGLRGVLLAAVKAAEADLPAVAGDGGAHAELLPQEIEERLRARLAVRGVLLHRLENLGVDVLEVGEGPRDRSRPADTHLLVIGLDGADWGILDPLLARGRLPNLKRLIEGGVRAKLMTISPTLSPVVWTTIATGVEPNRHGILDFLVPATDGGAGEPVTSAQRRAAAVWELLSEAGIPVGVVGWWATWPADPVKGWIVSDRLAYQLFGIRPDLNDPRGKTWPSNLYAAIRPLIVPPESVGWEEVLPYLAGPRHRPGDFDAEETKLLQEFRTLLASGRTYLEVALDLRRRLPARFEVVYFEGTDTVGHLFAPYRPPRLPGVPAARYESFREIVDRYYETVDGYLGSLLEGRGSEWTVMVLSDHGFATDETRPRSTDSRIGHGAAADWHRRFGVLVLSGAHVAPGRQVEEASVYDVAPTLLALYGLPIPGSWRGRVLAAALEPSFLDAHPVTFRSDEPERRALRAGEGAAEQEGGPGAEELVAKLRNLGYVGPQASARPTITARNNAGVALLAEGKFAEAAEAFRAGLRDQPGQPHLLVNLGIALRFQGKLEEARQLFERGLDQAPSRRQAGHQLAQMSLEAGDLGRAERYSRLVLRTEPRAAEVLNVLGLVLEKRGDLRAAATTYLRASEADPNAAEPRNNLGNLAKARGSLAEAETWYQRAIEADPYFMGAYNNLALIYQDRGELQKAIDLYGRALQKSPTNAVVVNNLGSFYYAKGDLQEARRLWERANLNDPSYPSPLNNLAGIEIASGRFEAAEGLLRRALELNPSYGDALINLAIVERARGRFDAARADLEKAKDDPASRPAALTQLGILLLDEGKLEEALRALEEARRLGARTSTLNALGECYRRLGRRMQAEVAWRASLALDPGQDAVRRSLEQLE